MNDIDRLDVQVDSAPHPGLIRSRIEAALAGRASDPGPEWAIGEAVAAAMTGVVNSAGTDRGADPGAGKGAPS